MSLQKIPKIFCLHKNAIISDSEILCSQCGVVLGTENFEECNSESILNLFQQVENGTKIAKIDASKRIHEKKYPSSAFSNACSKLSLPNYAAIDAWKVFCKLEKKSMCPKSYIAIFSLFSCCKKYSIPRSQQEIRNAVMMTFCLKKVPTVLKSYTTVHQILLGLQEDEKNKVSVEHATESFEYYLNLYCSKIKKPLDIKLVKDKARRISNSISGNCEYRARMAVKMVVGSI